MGYNKINRVSQKAFDTLTKLRVLWLDNNQIRSLPDDIFYNCEYLEQINLGANQETVQIVKIWVYDPSFGNHAIIYCIHTTV